MPRKSSPTPSRRVQRDRDVIRFLTVDECAALFRSARKTSKRDHALLLLAYRHGLRAPEVGLLKRDDLDLKTNRIQFERLSRSRWTASTRSSLTRQHSTSTLGPE